MADTIQKIPDEDLQNIAGGATRNYIAAVDVMMGRYGNGDERRQRLTAAGYNYNEVQHLVNGLAKGYDKVAMDVIAGKYGNNQERMNALYAAGYDARLVQDIVNGMLMNG